MNRQSPCSLPILTQNRTGIENKNITPSPAEWSVEKGEFILPYEAIRTNDPENKLMEFIESSYRTGVDLAGWDTESLERKPPIEKPKK